MLTFLRTSTAADANTAADTVRKLFCGNPAPPCKPQNKRSLSRKVFSIFLLGSKRGSSIRQKISACLETNTTNFLSRLPPAVGWGRPPLDNGMVQIGTRSRQIGGEG